MTDTYDRRVQLGASRRRLEDAQALDSQKRWAGAVYLGGYAIECSLKSLICYNEGKNNFKDTATFKKGMQGADLHNLAKLLEALPSLERFIQLDRTNTYKQAWNTVSFLWRNDELRYSDKQGDEKESRRFIEAVQILHRLLLEKQGET
ncbi:MAG: hypothetical protein MUC60_11485 [Oscillatoria sp. Prado101]|nr:hypothetical protein [Oscillatoria sp. Prado101]